MFFKVFLKKQRLSLLNILLDLLSFSNINVNIPS